MMAAVHKRISNDQQAEIKEMMMKQCQEFQVRS